MPIDERIKTRVSIDPDTGAKIINKSWSSELKKKQPIVRKPVSRETFVTEPKKTVSPKISTVKTSGERTIIGIVNPKPAKETIKAEIKTSALPDKKITPKLTHKDVVQIKAQKDNEDLKKNYPGMSLEDARAKRYKERVRNAEKSAKENRKFVSVGNGDGSEKQRSSSACQSGCR